MTEQERQIIVQISEEALHTKNIDFNEIEHLGGLTNHNFKVVVDGKAYVYRLPGEGTSEMINRKNEHVSTQIANDIGVDTGLIYFDDKNGIKVSRYIENAETMSLEKIKAPENLKLVADIFKVLHNCGKSTIDDFNIFSMIEEYERIIKKEDGSFYSDYNEVKNIVYGYKKKMDELGIKNVLCHNDPLCENFIKSGNSMYLIDWEYSGMNDPIWDLADVSIEADLNFEQENLLLKAYLGENPNKLLIDRLWINKIYLDFLWSLWGEVRCLYGSDLEQYAIGRYERAKNNIKILEEIKKND